MSKRKSLERDYVEQIQAMIKKGKEWLQAHPGADIQVQFNWPKTIMPVTPVSEAVRMHVIMANPEGLEFLKSLWRWDVNSEPTAFMVRFVMDTIIESSKK